MLEFSSAFSVFQLIHIFIFFLKKEELNTLELKTSLHTSVGISAHFPGNTEESLFASTGRH